MQQLKRFAMLGVACLMLCVGVPARGADLARDQFAFKGRARILNVGGNCEGLAYNPVSDTWITIAKSGTPPYTVAEFRLNVDQLSTFGMISTTLVRTWGDLNVSTSGPFATVGLPYCRGLLYDNSGGLLVNAAQYYANGANNPILGRYRLDISLASNQRLQGPWKFDKLVSSERAKGCLCYAPKLISEQTQQPILVLSYKGSTAQECPWGLGVVSLSEPELSCPPGSHVPARVVAFWPMKLMTNGVQYSDYPRTGYPVTYLQTTATGTVVRTPLDNKWNSYDLMQGGVFVDDTLVVFGRLAHGHEWYGNPGDYQFLPSLIDPAKSTTSVFSGRGVHVEKIEGTVWLISGEQIKTKFLAGDPLISHYDTLRADALGGTVPLQSQSFSQPVWLPGSRLLAVINHGQGNTSVPMIYFWGVAP